MKAHTTPIADQAHRDQHEAEVRDLVAAIRNHRHDALCDQYCIGADTILRLGPA